MKLKTKYDIGQTVYTAYYNDDVLEVDKVIILDITVNQDLTITYTCRDSATDKCKCDERTLFLTEKEARLYELNNQLTEKQLELDNLKETIRTLKES